MSQKAVTDGLGTKADLIAGKVPNNQLPQYKDVFTLTYKQSATPVYINDAYWLDDVLLQLYFGINGAWLAIDLRTDVVYIYSVNNSSYYWNGAAILPLGAELTKATIEFLLTGEITSHTHDTTYLKISDAKQTIDAMEQLYSYGVLLDNNFSSPIVTRVGNIDLHKTLPIQSGMRGCVLKDDGTVNYYLKSSYWAEKYDSGSAPGEGVPSILDGTDGQVMVEIPAYYVKYNQIDQMKFEIRISLQPLTGYTLIPKKYISAYKAALQRSTNKLASVINLTADYRGGNNNATYDAASATLLGKPATGISLTNFRSYARKRASGTRWNCMTYDMRKSLYWLFVIEYANLNSQDAVTAKDPVTGLMKGGLGDGFTTANGTEWSNFNGNYPACPCGVTNSLGNASGEVNFSINDFGGAGIPRTFKANRYRGIENPFGDIWEWTDGILIDVKTDADGGTSKLYVGDNPANYTDSILINYKNRGLISRTNGWVKAIMLGVGADLLPINTVGGGSTTYFCDYFYKDINSSVVKGVVFGGHASYGAMAGLVFAHTSPAPSIANSAFGSRLCFV
jgi:hypothetical protein